MKCLWRGRLPAPLLAAMHGCHSLEHKARIGFGRLAVEHGAAGYDQIRAGGGDLRDILLRDPAVDAQKDVPCRSPRSCAGRGRCGPWSSGYTSARPIRDSRRGAGCTQAHPAGAQAASSGVPGLSATPRTIPRAASLTLVRVPSFCSTRCTCEQASTWIVMMSAPAAT